MRAYLLPCLYATACRFGDVTQTAYSFWLYDLCDNYLELIKPVVGDTSEGNKKVRLCNVFGLVWFWFGLVWFGFGLVWFGLVWFGLVWFGFWISFF